VAELDVERTDAERGRRDAEALAAKTSADRDELRVMLDAAKKAIQGMNAAVDERFAIDAQRMRDLKAAEDRAEPGVLPHAFVSVGRRLALDRWRCCCGGAHVPSSTLFSGVRSNRFAALQRPRVVVVNDPFILRTGVFGEANCNQASPDTFDC
jgi:hypothetical protein